MSKHKARDVDLEMGTGNVYADLGYGDADEMRIKAQLVAKIAEVIKQKSISNPGRNVAGDVSTQTV